MDESEINLSTITVQSNKQAVGTTVGPWEARFLGNEKTRAAQNRAS